ncbi:hypothetical protein [Vibrio sp. EA2]|uniref:hypothetical protein n=1 Tax=Vibrio sp. EA2 TaxID=3079860 RepID=UPI0029498ECC|nr:hypothetical protein [Vibrio sp. EA2]MDV6251865.1 hypothetical protein [Vibrio sp. EA2]
MSVQRKHTDSPPRYADSDFTTEQRHRFTAVANAAQQRRDVPERVREKEVIEALSKQAFKPIDTPQQKTPSRARQVIILLVILLVGLWAMYRFAY